MSVAQRIRTIANDTFHNKQVYETHKNIAALHSQLVDHYTTLGDKKSMQYHTTQSTTHQKLAEKFKPRKTLEQIRQDKMR